MARRKQRAEEAQDGAMGLASRDGPSREPGYSPLCDATIAHPLHFFFYIFILLLCPSSPYNRYTSGQIQAIALIALVKYKMQMAE